MDLEQLDFWQRVVQGDEDPGIDDYQIADLALDLIEEAMEHHRSVVDLRNRCVCLLNMLPTIMDPIIAFIDARWPWAEKESKANGRKD